MLLFCFLLSQLTVNISVFVIIELLPHKRRLANPNSPCVEKRLKIIYIYTHSHTSFVIPTRLQSPQGQVSHLIYVSIGIWECLTLCGYSINTFRLRHLQCRRPYLNHNASHFDGSPLMRILTVFILLAL